MILHPDGRVEGTPEEVAAYKLLLANDARQTLAAGGKVRLVEANVVTPEVLDRIKRERESYVYLSGGANTSVDASDTKECSNDAKELTEEQVSSLSTQRLSEELAKREGVKTLRVDPYEDFTVIKHRTGERITSIGPAIIHINQD